MLVGHRDLDLQNSVGGNLAALRRRCRIVHDEAEHLRRRRLTDMIRRALGNLFTGPHG